MMSTVFVSSCRIDDTQVAGLIDRLRAARLEVIHSPRNPSDGDDERWRHWYDQGCALALGKAHLFVSVITPGWDHATWMQHERLEANKLVAGGRMSGMYRYNPAGVAVNAQVAIKSFGEELPAELEGAAQALIDAVGLSNGGGAI